MSHNFKKQFGQNFLRNARFVHELLAPLDLKTGDLVIEVGPGDGMVTKAVLDSGANIVSIEVDYDLLPNLIRKFVENPRFKIKHKDILELNIDEDLKDFSHNSIKVVGSLPYNISKKIIRNFLKYSIKKDAKFKIEKLSFIVQDEVAKVYVASAPKATYLSNMAQIYSKVKKLKSIPASQFTPKPKVDGGILYFDITEPIFGDDETVLKFEKFLKASFKSSRKTLYNNLTNFREKQKVEAAFIKLELKEAIRPSELTFNQWQELFKLV